MKKFLLLFGQFFTVACHEHSVGYNVFTYIQATLTFN